MKNYNLEILAIIPARGDSKGIPQKNIKKLAGKPLISYTIETAQKSKYISRIVVSTDNPTIAEVSKKYGVEVPSLRPVKLSQDDTPMVKVILHVLNTLKEKEKYIPDIVVLLQPTSPLRRTKTIDDGIKYFLMNNKKPMISITKVKQNPYWMKILGNGYLYPLLRNKNPFYRRQDFPDIYIPNGCLYICSTQDLKNGDPFNNDEIVGFIMGRQESVDIDEQEDLILAEYYIRDKGKII